MLYLVGHRTLSQSLKREILEARGAAATAAVSVVTVVPTFCHRSYWQEHVQRYTDNRTGKKRHEDPTRVVKRFQDQVRSDGEALIDLHTYNDKHEKAWMRRKRLNEKKRYEFDKKNVMDLAKYIEFVQDNKEKK